MRARGVIGTLLGLSLVCAGPITAAQAISFTEPITLGSVDAATPQIQIDPQGRSTVAWEELEPGGERIFVKAMRLTPQGLPGPVHTLGTVPNLLGAPQCVCPQLSVAPSGKATVAWQHFDGETMRVQAAHLDAAGNPSAAATLSDASGSAWTIQLEAGPTGVVTVVWKNEIPERRLEVVQLDPEGVPGEVHQLTEPGAKASLPALTVDAEGIPYLAWTGEEGIETTTLDEEGAPKETSIVSPSGEDAGAADIVVDSKGRATISWWRGSGAYEAKAVRLASDGTPGPVVTLNEPTQNTFDPRIAIDPQDRVTATFEDFEERINVIRLDAEGVPGTLHRLSGEGHVAAEPQLAAAPDGRVMVSWTHPAWPFAPEEECLGLEFESEDDVVRVAFIDPNGEPEQVYDVSSSGQQSFGAQLALDPLGLPRLVWMSYDGTYFCPDQDTRVRMSSVVTMAPAPVDPVDDPLSPSPPPAGKAVLRLAEKGTAKGSRVVLRARCLSSWGNDVCDGHLRLVVPASVVRRLAGSVVPRPRVAPLVLARGKFRLAPRRKGNLVLKSSKSGRRLIAVLGQRWITTHARGAGVALSRVRIRPVRN